MFLVVVVSVCLYVVGVAVALVDLVVTSDRVAVVALML